MASKPYPSDVTDDQWMFVIPYLTLMHEDAPQREHDLGEVFNALRWIVRDGSPWRYLANDLPPWEVVYQQTQRWIKAGVFEAKRVFVLLPRRWVVERSFAWLARCRRLAKDYERLPATVAGLHLVAFACLMPARLMDGISGSA